MSSGAGLGHWLDDEATNRDNDRDDRGAEMVTRKATARRSPATLPTLPLESSIGYQIRTTHRLVQRALQARIEHHGVTLGMWYFLRVLWDTDGLTQSELSARIGTMEPTTLSAVASMEQAGLVRRERHGLDKRKINVFLTDKGAALRNSILPEGIDVVRIASAALSEAEVAHLLDMLKRIQASLEAETAG